jgi:hypothetical protein
MIIFGFFLLISHYFNVFFDISIYAVWWNLDQKP